MKKETSVFIKTEQSGGHLAASDCRQKSNLERKRLDFFYV